MAMRRTSLTLPPAVIDDLDYIASRSRASRSAVASEILSEALPTLVSLLRSIPDSPEPGDALRFRGQSAELIRERLDNLRDMSDDLLSPSRLPLDPCGDRPAGCSCDYSSGERVAPSEGCLVHREEGQA